MWTRKELKDRAKVSFRANYWKALFVALILVAISGWGFSGASFSNPATVAPSQDPAAYTYSDVPGNVDVDIHDGKIRVDVDDEEGGKVHVDIDADDAESLGELIGEISHEDQQVITGLTGPVAVVAGLSITLVVLVVIAIALAFYAFVFNPVEIGCRRFLIRNLNQRAEVKELAFAYDNNYLESVKTLFLRDLFIILWGLLLIVPGIYKAYEYRMIPYLMAEDPNMTKDRAFAESKRLMDGQKWNAFVLDLSFLGWNILSALTLGILGVFYVNPYQEQTNAALYDAIRYGSPESGQPAQAWPSNPYGGAPDQPVQPGQAAQAAPYGTASAQAVATAPLAVAPVAVEQAAAMPAIASASQPPVPPFAAVGYVPEDDVEDEFAQDVADAAAEEPAEDPAEKLAEEPAENTAVETADAAPDAPAPADAAPAEGAESPDSPEA